MRGAFGRLLVVIGYILIPCAIVAIYFSLPIGIALFILSIILIDNIKIRNSTPKQRTQSLIEAIRNLLLVGVLVIFGMGLENQYHLYNNHATYSYLTLAFILFFIADYLYKKKSGQKLGK